VFGSSPETHLRVTSDRRAYIDPIAGTFRRTGDDRRDHELAERLLRDPKENAEHIMLVDLARNDLSRSGGKVEVEYLKQIQFYSHVIHMVSRVSYGGCIGTFGFDGSINQTITIRSFLSRNGRLYSQAGAGVTARSE